MMLAAKTMAVIGSGAAAVLVAGGVSFVVPAEAQSSNPGVLSLHRAGCVTAKEYGDAKRGMKKKRVHQIFGTAGVRFSYVSLPVPEEFRRYKGCATGSFSYCLYYKSNELKQKVRADCGSPSKTRP